MAATTTFSRGDKVRWNGTGDTDGDIDKGELCIVESTDNDELYPYVIRSVESGDTEAFDARQLVLVEKKGNRRTFMLIKDTPTMLKGAILQEECDDGTQPYKMLNQETHCKDGNYLVSIAKRELVEKQPKWFVEVFKVTPEYMTKEQLAQFETFKTAQAKKGKK